MTSLPPHNWHQRKVPIVSAWEGLVEREWIIFQPRLRPKPKPGRWRWLLRPECLSCSGLVHKVRKESNYKRPSSWECCFSSTPLDATTHCDDQGLCCMHSCTLLHFCLILWCNLTGLHVWCSAGLKCYSSAVGVFSLWLIPAVVCLSWPFNCSDGSRSPKTKLNNVIL